MPYTLTVDRHSGREWRRSVAMLCRAQRTVSERSSATAGSRPLDGLGAPNIFMHTIGHSTRPINEFIGLLREHAVETILDVRTVPRSRFNPQFNLDVLPATLSEARLQYRQLPALGGLRKTQADSENTGWRNASFRGYADYMLTVEFQTAVDELIELARHHRSAIMCAEAVPWRCHRSLIADALTVRGHHLQHIIGANSSRPHALTSFARVENCRITYPSSSSSGA